MYRTICDHNHTFAPGIVPRFFEENADRAPVDNSVQLEEALKREVARACEGGKAALALSGGIDSAILARFMPKGSVAYTFKCVVPGIEVTDETPGAARYAEACGLDHRVVEIYWEDFEELAPKLMKHKGAPIHSIEVQICKASMRALEEGFDTIIFGESSDLNYGGLDGLLSKDWTIPQFIERYSYVLPYKALKSCEIITEPLQTYSRDGYVDTHEFDRHPFYVEAMGSYQNGTETAGIKLSVPYSKTFMNVPLDYSRIRCGENKYLVREVFQRLYPDFPVAKKVPMPRPMNEWMKDWKGPVRDEFWPHCVEGMTGDQKWLVWALEKFLDIIE
jgi:asparagine synthetase B (glutamine-hydrolysing)